jgi:hypothetical protein
VKRRIMEIALATGWPPSEVRAMTRADIAALDWAMRKRERSRRRGR